MKNTQIISMALAMAAMSSYAVNPIIQTIYTADPAPLVHQDRVYLYTSHDEDVSVNNFFTMKDWSCYSSTDLVNWTDHGIVASLHDFKWAGRGWGGGFTNGAWAPHAIEREGKWYLYCPLQGRGIGVLVADNPFGPFQDPLGKPLIPNDNIDPAAFIDHDGQAYLYWGNPKCKYVKLNPDMISYDTSIGTQGIVVLDMTVAEFGKRSKPDEKRPTGYEEGPWLYQRNDRYYLFFAGGPIPEHLAYATGSSPVGPWKYGGIVMQPQSAFTIHPGVIDFKGKTYLFYHNAGLPGGGGFKRSVCVDELAFRPDVSVQEVIATRSGVAPVATVDPYRRVEAETIAWESGVETAKRDGTGVYVTDISDGDFIKIRNVAFTGKSAARFMASVAGAAEGGAIELRLGEPSGKLIGTLKVKRTGGLEKWETQPCEVSGAAGVQDLVLKFTGSGALLFNFDWWKFE